MKEYGATMVSFCKPLIASHIMPFGVPSCEENGEAPRILLKQQKRQDSSVMSMQQSSMSKCLTLQWQRISRNRVLPCVLF